MRKDRWICAATIIAALVLGAILARVSLIPRTTGQIYVSGPQIYTRERLVNDRYREDAWLLDELKASPTRVFGVARSTATIDDNSLTATADLGKITPASSSNTNKPVPPTMAPIMISPHDRLNALRTFREQIRTLLIENQLDDRHDLRGNSLYRMRFDASVLPGPNTLAGARITVSILPPENLLGPPNIEDLRNPDLRQREQDLSHLETLSQLSPEQRAVWNRVYSRWLDSLNTRFEQSRQAIRHNYDDDLLTAADYRSLLEAAKTDAIAYREAVEAKRPLWSGLSPTDRQSAAAVVADKTLKGHQLVKDDPSPEHLKREIDRITQLTKAAKQSLYDIAIQQQLASATAKDVPVKGAAKAKPTQPADRAGCGDLSAYGSVSLPSFTEQAQPISSEVQYLLDHVFEPKIFHTVLGLPPDTINQAATLRQFTRGLATYGAQGPAFTFLPQTPAFAVTSDRRCFNETFQPLDIKMYTSGDWSAFFLQSDIDAIRLDLPKYDPQRDIDDLVNSKWDKSPDLTKHQVDTEFIEAGLINFIRMAGRQIDVFSYAATPSEPDELNAILARDVNDRMLATEASAPALGNQVAATLKYEQQRAQLTQRNATRKLVVSFGEQPNSVTANFGWVIQPQDPIDDTRYRQRASQTALTALVSLPAWWEEIRVNVAVSWDGDPPVAAGSQDYLIVLPVNFETVDANLFDFNNRSPAVDDSTLNDLSVNPCGKAQLMIPGRRLWRSTVVTLGGQAADAISVMPDMNGIIATFNHLDFPSTWTDLETEHKEPLMVWTSQGSTAPIMVAFKPPPDHKAKLLTLPGAISAAPPCRSRRSSCKANSPAQGLSDKTPARFDRHSTAPAVVRNRPPSE